MKRLLLPLTLLAIAAAVLPAAPPTYACSVGPDFDAIAESQVIVAGRIAGWGLIEGVTRWDPKTGAEPVDDPNYYGPYDPIRVEMTVDRVYKGSAPARIQLVAGNTLEVRTEQATTRYLWVGSSGACGAFDFDPTGMYAILGLRLDNHGRYRPSLPATFFIGPQTEGERFEQALFRLQSLAPGTLPTSGGMLPSESEDGLPWLAIAAGAGAGAAALLAASVIFLRHRTRLARRE